MKSKVINFLTSFPRLISALNEVRKRFQQEARPELDIPELEKVTQSEVLELVDWELKQAEDQQKLFGVGSWSLLVGLAGTIWATASLPALKESNVELVAIVFLLFESSLAFLRIAWTTATRSPEALDTNRTLRTSIIAGTDTNTAAMLSIFQNGVMFLATLFWFKAGHFTAAWIMCIILALCILGNIVGLAFLHLDIHIAPKSSNRKRNPKSLLLCITAIHLLLALALPSIGWLTIQNSEELPPLPNWQVAGLLVAAAYLLRQFLSAKAQARHQAFLRDLRRDLVLGFEVPSNAALQLAWRLSGFPTKIYVRGRLRALTKELCMIEDALNKCIEQIKLAIAAVKNAKDEERATICTAASKFLQDQLQGRTAAKVGEMGKSQAEVFLALFGDDAKKFEDYKNWEIAQQKLDAVGKSYEQIYQELLALVQGKD